MLYTKAVSHFGTPAKIAHALEGLCKPSAVYQWEEKGVVPKWAARRLEEITNGVLPVDESLYDAKERPIPVPKRKRAS
jgi:hypothetical protein